MNLNLKLDVDEEQTLQYVNKLTFNIPTGTATFNLNIVNPNLGNQSYILNQVAGVSQGMVAYQPSVALQSYVAVPAEADSTYIHNLPVGVPVPIELPVPTGLIPNHGFESGALENECNNTSEALKPSCINNSKNELRINYAGKLEEKSMIDLADQIPVQAHGYSFSGSTKPEWIIKKPCPLEMSIKAANIDVEFDKCESETFSSPPKKVQPVFCQNLPLRTESAKENSKTPFLILNDVNGTVKTTKTEITWENNNDKEITPIEDFQESLICEVEEVNDEEDVEEIINELKAKQFGKNKKVVGNVEDVAGCQNKNGHSVIKRTENQKPEDINSSEESDAVPLSVALKLKKVPANKIKKTYKSDKKRREEKLIKNKIEKSKSEDLKEAENVESREWSDSDDDVLDTKRIKSEFNYEYSCKKPMTPLDLNNEEPSRKFSRVRNCCSKRECAKKISVRDQKVAYKNFFDLESDEKKNVYLMNCIEHVPKSRNSEKEVVRYGVPYGGTEEKKLFVNENIQLEIENESNGNQKLSDEIQNAIKESLKDCMANELASVGDSSKVKSPEEEKGEKNTWNFYIVVDRCRRKVCLQFLLKLFRVSKSRVKQLQKKILSGSPLLEESVSPNQKQCELWQMAKTHLDSLPGEDCPRCETEPKHRRLTEKCSKEDLFSDFRKFYSDRIGKEPDIKFSSYKRFLHKKTEVSFSLKREDSCTRCEDLKKQELRRQKMEKLTIQIRNSRSNVKKEKKIRRNQDSGGDSSDDEPLLKRKSLKILLPLKAISKRNQALPEKPNSRNSPVDKRSKSKSCKEKSRKSGSKGRDVWSLMLLHLETMPYKECKGCFSKKKHRFLDPTFTTQGLFEDYRKYFLKETNSELGLGFTMYEKYFTKNCNYTILELDPEAATCPLCERGEKSKS